MPHARLDAALSAEVAALLESGTDKSAEAVIAAVIPPRSGLGHRYRLAGSDQQFVRMNSNSYLGLSLHPAVIAAEETGARQFGSGPGAVRFISGTYQTHLDLEQRLADFHQREAAIVYSSAYAAVLSTLISLITPETVVLSDELNHNCIINGVRMSRPASRVVYPHLDMGALDRAFRETSTGHHRRCVLDERRFRRPVGNQRGRRSS